MTKKHFIRLAEYIKQQNNWEQDKFTPNQLKQLAAFCHEMNSRFDYDRWIGYINGTCGPNGGKV